MNISDLASIIRAKEVYCVNSFRKPTGFSIDSRMINRGEVFFALAESKSDQLQFIKEAKFRGASAAVVKNIFAEINLPQLLVEDTLSALALMGKSWREQFKLKVISVCGSNGKTTVKDCIHDLMSTILGTTCTYATSGNFNNHIGVPLTLLGLNSNHRVAVMEIGANHPGEIKPLAAIVQPDIAVITNSGQDHLEGFGSVFSSAQTNAEVFSSMKFGTAILNADDPYYSFWRKQAQHIDIVSFGCDNKADVQATNIELLSSSSSFCVTFQQQNCEFKFPLPGRHNVSNALAAISVLLTLGKNLNQISNAIHSIKAPDGRLTILQANNGCRLIDDSYNANPSSLDAALSYLGQFGDSRWLVLGDMAELGEKAVELHLEAGKKVKQTGVGNLLTYGELSRYAAIGFGEGARHFNELKLLIEDLNKNLESTDTVLVKGSRSLKMERVVQALACGKLSTRKES
ncbi:MAG: UDP-N-acetylmuramoyl-tripeptide--D-alanyl-D-alanine ligase [Kangiellaceae bacterium]|nr:UDP-N-acetylmuramoyl-tripeptide--D-alanyl-D-alanine ligase [Kangiellaceae bacterium]MCW8998183.1 UDP-N-acetylmuramoyl-tripeptide--D-alanyl-D-alanine ligase [Kangiellaceae bacterium]